MRIEGEINSQIRYIARMFVGVEFFLYLRK